MKYYKYFKLFFLFIFVHLRSISFNSLLRGPLTREELLIQDQISFQNRRRNIQLLGKESSPQKNFDSFVPEDLETEISILLSNDSNRYTETKGQVPSSKSIPNSKKRYRVSRPTFHQIILPQSEEYPGFCPRNLPISLNPLSNSEEEKERGIFYLFLY